ncbi:MAG: hypothetical protein DMD96_01575 [Candidatus Rokuibacteriota bacterium]|nr:MAG: hypothetical protein DMD96_01575 [Candidatus Rokubacteria bacterium]
MSARTKIWALVLAATPLVAGPSLAADDPAVLKDLTAVIALQGQPCGQVVTAAKQGENDYIASCQDGSRYHVFVNAQGRVVVQKQ